MKKTIHPLFLLLAFSFQSLAQEYAKADSSILAGKGGDGHQDLLVRNGSGMQLMVAEENTQPTLRIVLPGHPASDRAIEVIFPEHVTVRERGSTGMRETFLALVICWRGQPLKVMAFAFTSGSVTGLARPTI